MSDEPLTQKEIQEIFGDEIPIEAVELLFSAPGDMKVAELREKMNEIAVRHKQQLMSFRERYQPPYTIERLPAPGYRLVASNGVALIYVYPERKGLPGKQLTDAEAYAIVKAFKEFLESSQ